MFASIRDVECRRLRAAATPATRDRDNDGAHVTPGADGCRSTTSPLSRRSSTPTTTVSPGAISMRD
jgi:hypothetical protein